MSIGKEGALPSKTELKPDPFWSERPGILTDKNRLIEFVPTADMTKNERLNAIVRFLTYLGIIFFVWRGRSVYLYLGLGGLLFTLFLFKTTPQSKKPHRRVPSEHPNSDSPNPFVPSDQPECIPPTLNNPFMNVLQNEYIDNPTRPPACPYEEVKDQVESNFNYNLYKDIGESLWDRNNSQREWFTMPWTTIPNDQGGFANWLYKTGPVCKSGGSQESCLRYEDLRANRPIVGDSEYLA